MLKAGQQAGPVFQFFYPSRTAIEIFPSLYSLRFVTSTDKL
jgi:hypothetical protein